MAKKIKREPSEGPAMPIDASVRWVRVSGEKTKAICFRGEKFGNCVMVADSIKVHRIPLAELDRCPTVKFGPDPYPVGREVDRLRELQEEIGITWPAHRLIHTWRQGFQVPRHELDTTPSEDEAFHIRPKLMKAEETAKAVVKKASQTAGRSILAEICTDLGLDPGEARKRLRARGMRAPYTDAEAIRGVLK